MSALERERSHAMRALTKGLLLQREAAERLGLSVRQVKRLLQAWRARGQGADLAPTRAPLAPSA